MAKSKTQYLVGLIGPEVLSAIEADSMNPVFMDLEACNALEIRYDFFPKEEWPGLSARLRKVAPKALQIGTIRLQHDGGRFPDNEANSRMALWQGILEAEQVPEWLDLERDYLHFYKELKTIADKRFVKLLVSEHNFARVPNELELATLADDLMRVKAPGLKIAAMSTSETDCDRLYKFIKKNAKNFLMFAAFGMGETGKISRLWSLKEGANLTYGAIGKVEAPGQIDVISMQKALKEFVNINSQEQILAFLR